VGRCQECSVRDACQRSRTTLIAGFVQTRSWTGASDGWSKYLWYVMIGHRQLREKDSKQKQT
jgi:hypothetical protein